MTMTLMRKFQEDLAACRSAGSLISDHGDDLEYDLKDDDVGSWSWHPRPVVLMIFKFDHDQKRWDDGQPCLPSGGDALEYDLKDNDYRRYDDDDASPVPSGGDDLEYDLKDNNLMIGGVMPNLAAPVHYALRERCKKKKLKKT